MGFLLLSLKAGSKENEDLNEVLSKIDRHLWKQERQITARAQGETQLLPHKGSNGALCNGSRFYQSTSGGKHVISYTMALRGLAAELQGITPWKGSSEDSVD